MMSLRGRHNYKKKKPSRRQSRYHFLKEREDELALQRRWRKFRRYQEETKLLEQRDAAYNKLIRQGKKTLKLFMFRKGTFPNKASYENLPLVIYNRSQVITEKYCGRTVSIYNGYLYFNFKVTSEAVGYKFGEAAPTKQWRPGLTHANKKKEKIKKKIPKKAKVAKGAKSAKPAKKKVKK